MPPQLALIICTIFVLWLLRLDHKQAPEVSFALWVPTLWILFIASKPLGIWFGTGGEDMESGSPWDRYFLIALFCLGLIILVIRRFNWSDAIRENIWLMLLIGYMLVSILWSDIPYISFKRWFRELIAVVMAFIVASEPEPRQALKSIFRRTIYLLIPFSYILIHYFAEYGREYHRWSGELMWVGVTTHKNSLCRLCLFAAFFLIWTFIRRWQGRDIPVVRYQTYLEVFILFLTLWLMGGPQHTFTYSATSNATFAVGLSSLISFFWMRKLGIILGPKPLIAFISFIIVYGIATPYIGSLSLIDVSSLFERSETLTGRSDIWATLIPFALERPLLGSGFGGFWTTTIRELTSNEAHNGYLDVVLGLGFFGLSLTAIFLLSCIWKAQRVMSQNFDWGAFWFCWLLMAAVYNIVESSFDSFSNHMSAILMFLLVSFTASISYTQVSSIEVEKYNDS